MTPPKITDTLSQKTHFKLLLICISVFLVLISNRSIAQTTYFVDKNNPSSSDLNPGSEQLPWLTIHKANRTVSAGDTVVIKAGIYHDWIHPGATGTAKANIVYVSEPLHKAILDGWVDVDSAAIAGSNWQQAMPDSSNIWTRDLISPAFTEAWMDDTIRFGFPFSYTCDTLHFEQGRSYIDSTATLYVWLPPGETPFNHTWHVTLKSGIWLFNNKEIPREKYVSVEGFTLENFGLSGINVSVDYVKILNCISRYNGRAGIEIAFCNHVLIEGNNAYENCRGIGFSQGISAYNVFGTDIVFKGNISHHNFDGADPQHCGSDGNGFTLDTSPPNSGATFINNVAYNNTGAGFGVYQACNGVFINNTSFNNNLKSSTGGECHITSTAAYASNHLVFKNNIFAGGQGERSSMHIKYSWVNPPVDVKFDHNLYYRQNADETSKLFELTIKYTGGEEHRSLNISEFQNLSLSYDSITFEPQWGVGSMVNNPLLTGWQSGDFSLSSGSPAIDNGSSEMAPATDFYGTQRPQGNGIDMGAYEFIGNAGLIGIKEDNDMSLKAYPNPFNRNITIQYQLSKPSAVELTIRDLFGRIVYKTKYNIQNTGNHKIIWDGTNSSGIPLENGIYFIRLGVKQEYKTFKIIMLKQ